MRVGMIGTGAISHKHAQAYKNIGFQLTVCTDVNEAAGRRFAEQYGCRFVPTYEEVCRDAEVDYVDSLMGAGFTVLNPNAISTCSCGHSFETGDGSGSAHRCH